MTTQSTTAIVLRSVEFSETSLVVTLLTRDLGRISAIAKGARRPKGPFEGALDLLSVCKVVVISKNASTLDLLTEAKLHRRFRGATRSLIRLHCGYYLVELLRCLTEDHDPDAEVFDHTIATLGLIDSEGPALLALLHFESRLLQLLGLAPVLDRCADCGSKEIANSGRMFFESATGGVVCMACRSRQPSVVSISPAVLGHLATLVAAKRFVELPQDVVSTIRADYSEFRSLLNRYLQHVCGRSLRMIELLPTQVKDAEANSKE
ncbi:MAG: DNA repair protein RecO [Planctomycetota bacterium]